MRVVSSAPARYDAGQRLPVQAAGVHLCDTLVGIASPVLLHNLGVRVDEVLALPVLDQPQALQGSSQESQQVDEVLPVLDQPKALEDSSQVSTVHSPLTFQCSFTPHPPVYVAHRPLSHPNMFIHCCVCLSPYEHRGYEYRA